MPVRRKSNPVDIQCIWNAIKHVAVSQRYPTEATRIVNQLCRLHGSSTADWNKCIADGVDDHLIEKATGKESETRIFKLPGTELPVLDGLDWYCFECHKGGNVQHCKNKACHRVYHKECVGLSAIDSYRLFKNLFRNANTSTVFLKRGLLNRRKSLSLDVDGIEEVEPNSDSWRFKSTYNNSLCLLCNLITLDGFSLEKSELNHLFMFVLRRIRSWIPPNITHTMEKSNKAPSLTPAELDWRANHLFFEHKDMSVIEVNINNESYSNCHGLLSDVLTVKHNIGIFHGVDSQEYAATNFLLRDTLHDMGEIIGCVDCYKHSNEKINELWFSLPCRIPHEVVWAKQKGYCYWPAKVIKVGDTHYDVRFFGSRHERALLLKQFIQPITKTKESLRVNNSAWVVKAIEEMELYQKLSQNPLALEAFIAASKKTTPLSQKWKLPSPSPKKSQKTPKLEAKKPVTNNRKRSRASRTPKKEDTIPTSLPFMSDEPSKKRGRKSAPVEKDRISPEIGMEIPVVKKKGRLTSTKKDRMSPEIGSPISNISVKAKGGKTSKKVGRPRQSDLIHPVKRTRSVSKMMEHFKEIPDAAPDNSDIINISDGEDNVFTFSGNLTMSALEFGNNYEQLEQVTSSTEVRSQEMQQLDHPFSDEVEMMRRTLEGLTDKKEIINSATNCMQREIDRITEKHNDLLKRLFDSHNAQISETKKKQWCYYCEQDAIYHCCWNTAYCSTTCQQQHWQAEHKKVCRRKR